MTGPLDITNQRDRHWRTASWRAVVLSTFHLLMFESHRDSSRRHVSSVEGSAVTGARPSAGGRGGRCARDERACCWLPHRARACWRDSCRCAFVAWLLCVLAGCHQTQVYGPGTLPPDCLATQVHTPQRLNLTGFARSGTNSQQIIPGDLLQVAVTTGLESSEDAAWPPVRVSDAGTIELPLVGAVPVAGLELEGAERRVRDESIRRGIYRAPNVSVTLLKRRTNRVTVVGAVREPGVKELPASDCDLFAVLVAAGGMADDASTVVEIRRSAAPPAQVHAASYHETPVAAPTDRLECIDLVDLERNGGSLSVTDGTVVMVMPQPDRTIQVIGLVNTPSQVKMPTDRDMRLLDAIAQAGGLTLQVANKVHIIRTTPDRDEPIVIATTIREAKSAPMRISCWLPAT